MQTPSVDSISPRTDNSFPEKNSLNTWLIKKLYKLPGNPYYPRCYPADKFLAGNFNNVAKLKGSEEKADCRHIGLSQIIKRQTDDSSENKKNTGRNAHLNYTSRQYLSLGGAEDKMDPIFHPALADRWEEILSDAKENCIVPHEKWGAFLYDSFKKMQNENRSHCYWAVGSSKHAMALRQRIKPIDGGQKLRYVANFYDPNCTFSDIRVYFDNLEDITGLTCSDFLDPDGIADYFGKTDNENREEVALFQRVPDTLHKQDITESIKYDSDEQRWVKLFASDKKSIQPAQYYHLMRSGLPLNTLKNDLLKCTGKAERIRLLQAKAEDGTPGLYMAMLNGHGQTVKTIANAIIKALKQEMITIEDAKELLAAKNKYDATGLCAAMKEGRSDAVKEFASVVIEALKQGIITIEDAKELLAAKLENRIPGLWLTLHGNHAATFEVFANALINAGKDDSGKPVLGTEDIRFLLKAKYITYPGGNSRSIRHILNDTTWPAVKRVFQTAVNNGVLTENDMKKIFPHNSLKKIIPIFQDKKYEELRNIKKE